MPIPDSVAGFKKALRDEITDMLRRGEDVSIPEVGKFSVVNKAARTARNPLTGGQVNVPAKRVVKFSPAKALKDALNS